MDFNLSEQEAMLQNLAREFAEKEVRPQAAAIDRSGEFPAALVKRMAAQGFQGLPYPAAYGGGAAGYLGYALVLEQVCRASLTAGAIMSVNTVPEEAVYRYGSEAQKKRLLTPLAKGDWLGGIGFTEADTGSDPKAITTTARRDGDSYVINGQKQFMAAAPALDAVLLFARGEGEGVTAFIVEAKVPGFRVQETFETLGLRGLGASSVYLEGVKVPAANRLGEDGQGFEILLEAISLERMSVAVQGVAAAQAALDMSLAYARQRQAGGKPIARMQAIQAHLAEMAAKTEAARWLAYRAAFCRDRGQSIQYEASLAKLFCSRAAVAVTGLAMQIHGSYGATRNLPVERLYRDAKMTELYVGTSEVHRSIVAGRLIQHDR